MNLTAITGQCMVAVLATLLLQSAVGVVPFGVLAALLVPLPAAYLGMRHGVGATVMIVTLTVLAAAGLMGMGTGLGYLILFGLPSLFLVLFLKQGLGWDRAVALSLVLLLLLGGLALHGLAVSRQSGMVEMVGGYLQSEVEQARVVLREMELAANQAGQLESALQDMQRQLLQVFPAAALVGYAVLLLCTLIGLHKLARSRYPIAGVPFDQWKVPETWIWALILAGVGVLLFSGLPAIAARNLLVVMLAVYFLQGLAIMRFFFRTRRVSPVMRTLAYVLLATLNPLQALVAGLGVFDLWVDFRKPRSSKD